MNTDTLLKILIVEDELPAARRISEMLARIPGVRVTGITRSISDTCEWFRNAERPDLALMDIELSDGQVFSVFEQVQVPCPVIFTTAYDEYTLKAFKLHTVDYLLKPIEEETLRKSLQKFREMKQIFGPPVPADIRELLQELRQTGPVSYKERFLLKAGQFFVSVEAPDIVYFRASEKAVYLLHSDGREYVTDHSLDELEKMLDPSRFFRANRQFIIARGHIRSMYGGFNGKMVLIPAGAEKLQVIVSRERAKVFKIWAGA